MMEDLKNHALVQIPPGWRGTITVNSHPEDGEDTMLAEIVQEQDAQRASLERLLQEQTELVEWMTTKKAEFDRILKFMSDKGVIV